MKKKKVVLAIFLIISLFTFYTFAYASAVSTSVYTDPVTNSSFTIPSGWIEKPLSKTRDSISAKLTSVKYPGGAVLFASYNLWGSLQEAEKGNHNRSGLDNDVLTTADIAEMISCAPHEISAVNHGGNKSNKASIETNTPRAKSPIIVTNVMSLQNGYFYQIMYSEPYSNRDLHDFESLLASIHYNNVGIESRTVETDTDALYTFSLGTFILNLLTTILLYSVPIMIYRYIIVKSPVTKKKAKIITIVYGICVFLLSSAIIFLTNGDRVAGSAILFWSWINYRILTGKKRCAGDEEDTSFQISETPQIDRTTLPMHINTNIVQPSLPPIKYCRKCGIELATDTNYCCNCGTRIERGMSL